MGKHGKHRPPTAADVEALGAFYPPPPPPPPEPWIAWLVPTFTLLTVAVFIFTMYVNNCPSSPHPDGNECIFPELGRYAFEPFTVNPLLGPTTTTLDKLGALSYNEVVVQGETWRFFASMWLHAGLIHLLANMMSFLFIGARLEQEFGFLKIGLLYIISGLGGSLLSCISIRTTTRISVGASGALFGLLGSMLSELITNWTIYSNKCAALLSLIVIIAINLVVGFIPHVDSSAHIGGFLTGFLLGFVLLMRPQFGWVNRSHIPPGYNIQHSKPKYKVYQYFLWVVAFLLLVVGFSVGYTNLFDGSKTYNLLDGSMMTNVFNDSKTNN